MRNNTREKKAAKSKEERGALEIPRDRVLAIRQKIEEDGVTNMHFVERDTVLDVRVRFETSETTNTSEETYWKGYGILYKDKNKAITEGNQSNLQRFLTETNDGSRIYEPGDDEREGVANMCWTMSVWFTGRDRFTRLKSGMEDLAPGILNRIKPEILKKFMKGSEGLGSTVSTVKWSLACEAVSKEQNK